MTVDRRPPWWLSPVASGFNIPVFDRVRAIRLDGVRIVDEVLVPLERLDHLETVRIHTGRVSNEGLARLAAQRPDLDVHVTDVRPGMAATLLQALGQAP